MSVFVKVPISTAVIESNPDSRREGCYEDDKLVIKIDTRYQNHHKRLGIGTKTKLYWGKESSFEVQERSRAFVAYSLPCYHTRRLLYGL